MGRTTAGKSRRAFLAGTSGLAASLIAARAVEAQAPAVSMNAPDRALWATWYDLPDEGRDEHLAWVQQSYLPALLKRRGCLWGAHYATIPDASYSRLRHTTDPAVPSGTAYVLIVGGEDSNVFGQPTPDELNAALSEADKKMLAMRKNTRWNIFAEAARVLGPGAKDYKEGMTLAPCIQFGQYQIDTAKEVDILAWYSQLQMPIMTTAEGCVRTRKLASVAGWAKMGILYEFASVEARGKHFGAGGGNSRGGPNKWGSSVQALMHAPGSPTIGRRISLASKV